MPRLIECRLAALFALIATGLTVLIDPAAAQQPTTAQRDAVRSACRSDYEAHCASVPTGGKPALMCLQKNMASLSPDCQKAVNAIGKSSAAPAAAPKPSTAAPSAAAPPAQAATGAAPAPAAPPSGGAATQATVGAAPMAPPPALTPRQELRLVRLSCGTDYRTYCGNVPLGGGRVAQCLRANAASLSPNCQSALMGLRQSR
jgi:Cysteine rich repeat